MAIHFLLKICFMGGKAVKVCCTIKERGFAADIVLQQFLHQHNYYYFSSAKMSSSSSQFTLVAFNSHLLLESPSKYTVIPGWWAECNFISKQVELTNYEKEIMGFMKNMHIHIQPMQEHYCYAMSFLSKFPIQRNFKEFHRSFYWGN